MTAVAIGSIKARDEISEVVVFFLFWFFLLLLLLLLLPLLVLVLLLLVKTKHLGRCSWTHLSLFHCFLLVLHDDSRNKINKNATERQIYRISWTDDGFISLVGRTTDLSD